MNKYPRIILFAFIFVMGFAIPSFGQIVLMQTRHVDEENMQEFIHRETTYWSEVARRAMIERRLVRWELWQIATGMNIDEGANFFFVVEYRNSSDVDLNEEIWDHTRVFPDMKKSEIETTSLSEVVDQVFLYSQVNIGTQPPKFVRVNYARASDLGRYLELENTVWQNFVAEQMEAKQTNVVSWELLSLMSPSGVDRPYDALTIDGFDKLSGALQPSYGSTIEYPDLEPFREVHQKGSTLIYSLVKAVRGP